MSKPVKEMVMADLRSRYSDLDSACVVDITGSSVQTTEKIRGVLKGKQARLEVIKNSLARRAFEGTALAPLGEVLEGPCALVTSPGSMVDIAKALVELAREHATLALKSAVLEGDPTLFTVVELSQMKSRTDLFGEVAMLMSSPGRAVAGCVGSPQAKIAGCLKAIVDKAA